MTIKDKIDNVKSRFKPRSLEIICEELEPNDFSENIYGTRYCALMPKYFIDCKYRANAPEENGMYKCKKYEIPLNEVYDRR